MEAEKKVMEKLRRIMIGEKTYPFKIDLNVLEYIQEEYGTIYEFERELAGIRYKKDENGNQIYDDAHKPVVFITEPSIRAIKTALPPAINEGLAIEADEENRPLEKVREEFIFRNCTVPYNVLGEMLYEEFKRCFAIKN